MYENITEKLKVRKNLLFEMSPSTCKNVNEFTNYSKKCRGKYRQETAVAV